LGITLWTPEEMEEESATKMIKRSWPMHNVIVCTRIVHMLHHVDLQIPYSWSYHYWVKATMMKTRLLGACVANSAVARAVRPWYSWVWHPPWSSPSSYPPCHH
jgi:hypothetical protein